MSQTRTKPRYANHPPARLAPLGRRLGELIETLVAIESGGDDLDAELEWAARQVEEINQRLAPHIARGPGVRLGLPDESPDARPYYVQGPMVGPHHPMYLETMQISHEEGVTSGTVNFGLRFEGPPGCVHGGYVAHFFDQVLGYQIIAEGNMGMTGSLQVKYRRPTRLDTVLRFEVRTVSASGGKVRNRGQLFHDDDLVAEGEGLFVEPKRGFARHVSS